MNSILTQNRLSDIKLETSQSRFFRKYLTSGKLKSYGFRKDRGIPCNKILNELFGLVFDHKNLYKKVVVNPSYSISKNSFYRFLNDGSQNWGKLLQETAFSVIGYLKQFCVRKERRVFIIDDTLYERNRSKKVEYLSKVFDHDEMKYRKGFRLLTLGWTDGYSFVPAAFRLISSTHCMLFQGKAYDKRTLSAKRRIESLLPMPEAALKMLEKVKHYGIDYVLYDAWFGTPKMILETRKLGYDVVCRMKRTSKIFFGYQGKQMISERLFPLIHREKWQEDPRIIGSIIVTIGKSRQKIKLVFCKDQSKSDTNDFQMIASSDIALSSLEIIQMYGKRWNIETFFKMCKTYLNLTKEYEGLNYDAMVAFISIVFLRYSMICLEVRNNEDAKTFGVLFFSLCDEVRDVSVLESLTQIFFEAFSDVISAFCSNVGAISYANALVDTFVSLIPKHFGLDFVKPCYSI